MIDHSTRRTKGTAVSLIAIGIVLLMSGGCRSVRTAALGPRVVFSDRGQTVTRQIVVVAWSDLMELEPQAFVVTGWPDPDDKAAMLQVVERTRPERRVERVGSTVASMLARERAGRQLWVVSTRPLVVAFGEDGRQRHPGYSDPSPFVSEANLDRHAKQLAIFDDGFSVPSNDKALRAAVDARNNLFRLLDLKEPHAIQQIIDELPVILRRNGKRGTEDGKLGIDYP